MQSATFNSQIKVITLPSNLTTYPEIASFFLSVKSMISNCDIHVNFLEIDSSDSSSEMEGLSEFKDTGSYGEKMLQELQE